MTDRRTIESLVAQAKALGRLPPPAERERLRVENGLSLRAVGEALGVSHTAIQSWERGVTPRGPVLTTYADLLDELKGFGA